MSYDRQEVGTLRFFSLSRVGFVRVVFRGAHVGGEIFSFEGLCTPDMPPN